MFRQATFLIFGSLIALYIAGCGSGQQPATDTVDFGKQAEQRNQQLQQAAKNRPVPNGSQGTQ
jgi:hypothetical protein